MDNVKKNTINSYVVSKLNSGLNNLPDWLDNKAVGYTKLGTPYYDSIVFKLDDNNFTEEFVNTLVSVSSQAEISRSFVNGRRGSIKQITNEGDYDITFNIKIVSEFTYTTGNFDITKVGVGFNPPIDVYRNGFNLNIADLLSLSNKSDFQMLALPNSNLKNLIDIIVKFYNDSTYVSMKVESLYLNDVFGIYNIVPYSIRTQQNTDEINTYNIIIQAYSDYQDVKDVLNEIIPK